MTIQRSLVDLLVCPACKGPLTEVHWKPAGEPATGGAAAAPMVALDCHACRLRYPITEGIPVMLVDQAERLRS
ncbi:MAG TPA: Trm112 family protein [Candidatus Binatia bacterium]